MSARLHNARPENSRNGPHRARTSPLLMKTRRGRYRIATADEVVRHARCIVAVRMRYGGALCSPTAVKDWLLLNLAPLEHEVFVVMFVDCQCRLLAIQKLFRGTLTHTAVHAREVVKEALRFNADAAFVAHNHPSGDAEPSVADVMQTRVLQSALSTVDVTLLDHFVVAGDDVVSFRAKGLLDAPGQWPRQFTGGPLRQAGSQAPDELAELPEYTLPGVVSLIAGRTAEREPWCPAMRRCRQGRRRRPAR